MAYQDASGTWYAGTDPNISNISNQTGLNSGYFSTSVIPGSPGRRASGVEDPGYAGGPNLLRTTYNGPGGNFSSTNGGTWQDASGMNIADLPGYLKMRQQQQSGADFSGYQNQLNNLLANPSSVTQTPGYQFALQQGNEAINRSAAAKGMLNSGNVLAELAKYGQGMASQGYQQQLNNLQSLMQGAQQFGAQTGYYANPQGRTWYGGTVQGGAAPAPAPQTGIWSTM